MKTQNIIACGLCLSLFLSSCFNKSIKIDKAFLIKHGQIEGTNVHTASIAEILIPVATQKDAIKYQTWVDRHHKNLMALNLSTQKCPCSPPNQCIWETQALTKFINQNNYLNIQDFRIEDTYGKNISSVKEKIISPSKKYTVYIMGGIDTVTQNNVILSIQLKGQEAIKLPMFIDY